MTQVDEPGRPAAAAQIATLHMSDLTGALAQGWADFRAAPQYGIVFAGVYVLGGLCLVFVAGGIVLQTLVLALGFPLLAPFAAVGLYEVSRRREAGQPLAMGSILAVVWNERGRQIPWLGAIIVIYFLFYFFLAHMIFALFLGLSAMTNISSSLDVFLTGPGLRMVAVELILGGVLAWLLFMLMAFSLPLALDREVDFITAMITSFNAVRQNLAVMGVWAGLIAVCVLLAMLPAFLGLVLVLPVFGHATWALYRRTLRHP